MHHLAKYLLIEDLIGLMFIAAEAGKYGNRLQALEGGRNACLSSDCLSCLTLAGGLCRDPTGGHLPGAFTVTHTLFLRALKGGFSAKGCEQSLME